MSLIKRSFSLAGHRTSIALEAPFWDVLEEIAAARSVPVSALIADLDAERGPDEKLASCLRIFALRNRP